MYKKRLFSALLCIVVIALSFSLTACKDKEGTSSEVVSSEIIVSSSQEGQTVSSEESRSESQQASSTDSSKVTSSAEKQPSADALAGSLAVSLDYAKIYPNNWKATTSVSEVPTIYKEKVKSGKITLLSSERLTDEDYKSVSAAFKKITGKTLEIDYVIVDWNDMRTQLQTMVLAKKGPDVFGTMYNGVNIYLRNKNLSRNVNDYINMNDAVFKNNQASSSVMYYDGELTSVAVKNARVINGILYNKSLIEQAGLEDPWSLYKKGEWNTETFLDYVEELTVVQNGVTKTYGYSGVYYDMLRMGLASGQDIVKITSNGKIASNIDSTVWTKYANLARTIYQLKSIDPLALKQNNVLTGTSAMRNCTWTDLYTDSGTNTAKKEGRVGWVPNPKDSSVKEYYHAMAQDYYLLPENSSNAWGGAAFVYAVNYAYANRDLSAEKAKFTKTYGFTEEEYKYFTTDIYNELTPSYYNWMHMPDFQYSLMSDIYTSDWSVVKEKVSPVLKKAISQANK